MKRASRGSAARRRQRPVHRSPARAGLGAGLAMCVAAAGAGAQALARPSHPPGVTIDLAALVAAGKTDSALRITRVARGREPGNEHTALALAALLAVSGDPNGAAALYDTVLRAPEPSEAAYHAATRFWTGTGRVDLAAGVARAGLDRYPRSAPLLTASGQSEAALGHWRAAADAWRRAVPLVPRREDAELPLVDALIAAADSSAALGVIRTLAAPSASRAARLVAAGAADSLGAGALADSITVALLATDPVDLSALEAAARRAERAGDTTRAVALYVRAAAIDSGGAEAPLALLRLTSVAPDSARSLLRRAVWHGLAAAERAGLAASFVAPAADLPVDATRRLRQADGARARATLGAALDRALLATPWGPAELRQLRLAWPHSLALQRYAALLAERDGDDVAALDATDRLLRATPADADLQRTRGRLLERLGRPADAAAAYARAFDLAPDDDATFRAAQRLAEARGRDALAEVLAQVARLRIRYPDSPALADHEIEVRQRLGLSPSPSRGGTRP